MEPTIFFGFFRAARVSTKARVCCLLFPRPFCTNQIVFWVNWTQEKNLDLSLRVSLTYLESRALAKWKKFATTRFLTRPLFNHVRWANKSMAVWTPSPGLAPTRNGFSIQLMSALRFSKQQAAMSRQFALTLGSQLSLYCILLSLWLLSSLL